MTQKQFFFFCAVAHVNVPHHHNHTPPPPHPLQLPLPVDWGWVDVEEREIRISRKLEYESRRHIKELVTSGACETCPVQTRRRRPALCSVNIPTSCSTPTVDADAASVPRAEVMLPSLAGLGGLFSLNFFNLKRTYSHVVCLHVASSPLTFPIHPPATSLLLPEVSNVASRSS